jgi:molybdate transport system substrate-binding protein
MTMTRSSFAATMAAGLLFSAIGMMDGAAAEAAEIKVLTSVALTSALDELAPQFERATGNKLTIGYGLISDIRKRIVAGETADVVILSRPAMEDLQKQDKIAPGSVTDVVETPVAVAVRAGAPKPDISSADALKRSLLAAKSIVYADPAKGGASGVHFAHVVEQLGIAEQLKSRRSSFQAPRPPMSSPRAKPRSASGRPRRLCRWRARNSSDHCQENSEA